MDKKSGDLVDMIHNKGIFRGNPLTEKQRFLISIDLVSGLEALHQEPDVVVHNDLKPPNCLFEQRVKGCIGDFGSAKYMDPNKTFKYFSFI